VEFANSNQDLQCAIQGHVLALKQAPEEVYDPLAPNVIDDQPLA